MDLSKDFETQLNLIAKFNGICLNIYEKLHLEYALKELMLKEKNEKTYFWGKITAEESDYFIAMGVNFKNHYEFPEKKYYYSTNKYEFLLLPETYEYHDKDFIDTYYKPLKGNPSIIIKKYKSDVQQGENIENNEPPQQPPQEENAGGEENKPPTSTFQDPDASVDDNAKPPEEPKENFTELLKLSYLVRRIDYDTNIVPEGALKLIGEHEIRINNSFKGLNNNDIKDISKWMHFRNVSEEKRKEIEEAEAVFRYDIFDSIVNDKVKGSWSFELDPTKTTCNLRSLLWPGYFAVHKANTKTYVGVYFGDGNKNADLPFMI